MDKLINTIKLRAEHLTMRNVNVFIACGLWFFIDYYTHANVYMQSYAIVTQFFQTHRALYPQLVFVPLKIHTDATTEAD